MVTLLLLLAGGTVITLLTLLLAEPVLPKRHNYAGRNVATSAGLSFIPIILLTLVLTSGGFQARSGTTIYLVYALVAVLVGFADDLWGGSEARGFRGHLGALKRGEVTTGLVKVVVLGGGAAVVGVFSFGPAAEALVAAFLLAGSVNLANLLDLRPGRALKFLAVPMPVLLFIAPYTAVLAVIGLVGGAIGLFYFDLKGRIMLGDAGAAVYGSVFGYLVVMGGPGIVWWVAGALILGLTVLAEVSSISRVIREVGVLKRFDSWGRGSDE